VCSDGGRRKRKGKERKSIYIAPFCTKVHTKRSGMDHTVLPTNNTMPAFLLETVPNVQTANGERTSSEMSPCSLDDSCTSIGGDLVVRLGGTGIFLIVPSTFEIWRAQRSSEVH